MIVLFSFVFIFGIISFDIQTFFNSGMLFITWAVTGGIAIQVAFGNRRKMNKFGKVMLWILFFIFYIVSMFSASMFVIDKSIYETTLPISYLSAGFSPASTITFLYLFIILRFRINERHDWVLKILIPTILMVVLTVAFGALKYVSLQAGVIAMYVGMYGTFGLFVILLLILVTETGKKWVQKVQEHYEDDAYDYDEFSFHNQGRYYVDDDDDDDYGGSKLIRR